MIFQGGVRLGPQSVLRAGTRYETPIVLKSRSFINVGMVLGRYTVIGAHTLVQRATIGSFCSIGEDCNLTSLASHPIDWMSTHPFQANAKPFEFDPEYAAVRKITRSWTYGPLTIGTMSRWGMTCRCSGASPSATGPSSGRNPS